MKPSKSNSRWYAITDAVRRLRQSPEDDVPLEAVARLLGWPFEDVQRLAAEMTELRLIETDMGLGQLPTIVEGM